MEEKKKELIPELVASVSIVVILQEIGLTVLSWLTWKWMSWIWSKFSGKKKDPEDRV